MSSVKSYREMLDEQLSEYKRAEKTLADEQESLKQEQQHLNDLNKRLEIVQHIAQEVQQQAHSKIAGVVTKCLQTVFDEPYEFRIHFEKKRNKTEARLAFVRNGIELTEPNLKNKVGGGVIDVTALALRVASLTLSRPQARKLLVLDEPFTNVRGSAYKARTRTMLESLSEELGVQFVLNTDIEEFRLGKVVEL